MEIASAGEKTAARTGIAVHAAAVRRLLERPTLRRLGRISYSVYLLHVPVIILLTPYIDRRLGLAEGGQ